MNELHGIVLGLNLKLQPSFPYCQSENHPWVDVAFGQQHQADFRKRTVMDRCRCYLQAAALLWPLRGGDREGQKETYIRVWPD